MARNKAATPSDQLGLEPATEPAAAPLSQEEVAEAIAILDEILPDQLPPDPEPTLELPPDPEPVRLEGPGLPVNSVLEHATAKLFAQIASVMADLDKVEWNKRNSQGGYQYASIDAFLGTVRPVMARHGLVAVPVQESTGVSSYRTSNGEVGLLDSTWTFLVCSAREDDVYIPITLRAVAPASMGAQAYGAVLSYALKNALRALFMIATGEAGEDVDQTHGQPLGARPNERTPAPQRRQDGPRPAGSAPASWKDHQDRQGEPAERIPQRTRQPAGNGGGEPPTSPGPTGPRPAIFRLRSRLNLASIGEDRVCKRFPPAEKLEDLTDDQVAAAHKQLDTSGIRRLPGEEAPA